MKFHAMDAEPFRRSTKCSGQQPPRYTLQRDDNDQVLSPQRLIKVKKINNGARIPTLGIVTNF